MYICSSTYPVQFQSTLLMRGATFWDVALDWLLVISIHAPHARSDSKGTS